MSKTYEFEYGDISIEEDSVPEWDIKRIEWVPMGLLDKAGIHRDYSNEDDDYSKCTQWMVMLVSNGDADEDDCMEVHIIPCASDGSSPCDTPFYQIYTDDIESYILECKEDRAYSM
jgi:hypothetical protein